MRFACDGEDLLFTDYVKFETLYNELEVILDYDYMMKDFKHFTDNSGTHTPVV